MGREAGRHGERKEGRQGEIGERDGVRQFASVHSY